MTLPMNQPENSAAKPNADSALDGALETAAESVADYPAPLTIRLDQFLQLCGVATGGQAKVLIQAGQVLLNGEVETRRRKKLAIGDEVVLDGETYEVAFEPESPDGDSPVDESTVDESTVDESTVSEPE